jgi:hypothetical protein
MLKFGFNKVVGVESRGTSDLSERPTIAKYDETHTIHGCNVDRF